MDFTDREQELARLCRAAESPEGGLVVVWGRRREELCRQAVPLLGERLGGVDHGPARRFWAGGGPEWDVVAEAVDGGALLLGEVKWSEKELSAAEMEQAVRALLAKGIPPVRREEGAEVQYALFVPKAPRRKAKVLGAYVVDAADVLGVLR